MKKFNVRNKILVGFLLVLMVFIVGMTVNYNSSQNLTNLNKTIVNKYSAIQTQSSSLSLIFEEQRALFKSYSDGSYQGAKDQFILNEQSIDSNFTNLEHLVSGSSAATPIINSLKYEDDVFANVVENGVMIYPTQLQSSSVLTGIQGFQTDTYNMYINMVNYKLTLDSSYLSKYEGSLTDLNSQNQTILSTLTQIQSINLNLYHELNNAYTSLTKDYNTWYTNVLEPATTSSVNGSQWAIDNKDSLNPIQNDLSFFVQTIPVFSNLEADTLTKSNANLQLVLNDLVQLRDFSNLEITNAKQQSINASNLVTSTTLIVLALGIALSLLIGFAISNGISKPLSNLSKKSSIISSGDLTVDIDTSLNQNSDEISELGRNFNQMVIYLKDTVKEISGVAVSLSGSAQELASSSEEVNSSSEEISAIAQAMAKGSLEQSSQINETVKISLELKKDFEEKVRNINQTSALIENISSQVNMLALNASIEAARAGEYGRGFSVVADNIRKLADDSKMSVAKVNTIITSLRSSISISIENLTKAIEKIASIAEENSSGAEESSAATEEQAATMEEMTASAQEIAHVASNLESLIEKFKLK